MALSGRELLLVIRARDEASRTLRRVSRGMSRMDREAASASQKMVDEQRRVMTGLTRELGNIQHGYQAASLAAQDLHRVRMDAVTASMSTLRQNTDDVNRAYQMASMNARHLRQEGKISAEQYQRQMRDANKARFMQIQQIQQERRALEAVRDTSQKTYRQAMLDARRMRVMQTENIRQQRIQAEELRAQHRAQIENLNEQNRLMRARGYHLLDNGVAVTTFGAAMTFAGVMGLRALASNINALIEYRQQASKTLTQVDTFKASLKTIEDVGKEVADAIPIPFEQIQDGLYDIYSSIDVNLNQSRKLIKQFSKDAVAGATELQTATRANLLIMNAYRIKTKDAADVSDFMFQLVRKGVGTYDEFAKTIGRSIPSAVRAGQSYQTLGAMMAFMTRNGMSAAMASTSAARALDAISHPKTIERLNEMGIRTKDANGNFRDLDNILGQLRVRFDGLTEPQRAKALYELFKSAGGTIQARRFFDQYFKNFDTFEKRLSEMKDASGAAQEAFEIMAESPQAKLQALSNQWMLLRLELAEHVLPIAMDIVDIARKILEAWGKLPSGLRKTIVVFAGLAAIVSVVMGVLTILAGALMMVAGAAAIMGVTTGTLLAAFAGIGAVIAGVAVAAYLLYKNWGRVGDVFDDVSDRASDAIDFLKGIFLPAWRRFTKGVARGWESFKDSALRAWETFKEGLDWESIESGVDDLKSAFNDLKPLLIWLGEFAGTVAAMHFKILGKALEWIAVVIGPLVTRALRTITNILTTLVGVVQGTIMIFQGLTEVIAGLLTLDFSRISRGFEMIGKGNLQIGKALFGGIKKQIQIEIDSARKIGEGLLIKMRDEFGQKMTEVKERAVANIRGLPAAMRVALENLPSTLFRIATRASNQFIVGLVTMPERARRKGISTSASLASGLFTSIDRSKRIATRTATAFATNLLPMIDRGKRIGVRVAAAVAGGALQAMPGVIAGTALRTVTRFAARLGTMPEKGSRIAARTAARVLASLIDLPDQLSRLAVRIVRAFISSLLPMPKKSKDVADDVGPALTDALSEIDLSDTGASIVAGLVSGMASRLRDLTDVVSRIKSTVADGLRTIMEIRSPSRVMKRIGIEIMEGLVQGLGGRLAKIGDIVTMVNRALVNNLTKKQHIAINRELDKEITRYRRIEKSFNAIVTRLERAQKRLQALRQERLSFIRETREAVRSYGSLANITLPEDVGGSDIFGNPLPSGGQQKLTASYISKQLKEKLANIKRFKSLLSQLLKMGFSKSIYSQALAMGPEEGLAYAEALVQATPRGVREINETMLGIEQESNKIANAGAREMYDAGIRTAEGLVRGLRAKRDALRRAARELAQIIINQLRRVLQIKSPSKIGTGIGGNLGLSIANALYAQRKNVANASHALAEAARTTLPEPEVSNTYASRFAAARGGNPPPVVGENGGPGGTTVKQEITVNTQEIDPRRHAAELGWALAERYRI